MNAYATATEDWLLRLAARLDGTTGEVEGHALRTGKLVEAVALQLGLSKTASRRLGGASRLHDVGKVTVPTWILLKPGPLTRREWIVVRAHAANGYALLAGAVSGSVLVRSAAEIALMHHENFDGSGYPLGVAGQAIPLAARIVRVCDAFDALSSDRPYRSALHADEALAVICDAAERDFDPDVVDALSRVCELDPSRRTATPRFELAAPRGDRTLPRPGTSRSHLGGVPRRVRPTRAPCAGGAGSPART